MNVITKKKLPLSKTSELKGSPKVRENTLLFNMMLQHLSRNKTLENFLNPFATCNKTTLIYQNEVEILHRVGITSIEKYDSQVIKKICSSINDLPENFLYYLHKSICTEYDLYRLLIKLNDMKMYLKEIDFDSYGKITFSKKKYDFNDIIGIIISILLVYKLTKSKEKGLKLNTFLFKNTDTEFLKYYENLQEKHSFEFRTRKEGDLNRNFISSLRFLINAFISIQLRDNEPLGVELLYCELNTIVWVDRAMSTIMDFTIA